MPPYDVDEFDRWAPTWERGSRQAFFRRLHGVLLDWAAEVGPAPGRVLDVGCGTGALLRAAGERWPESWRLGVDPAPRMVQVGQGLAEDGGVGVLFAVAAAEALPLGDGSFDLGTSSVSFHHWTDQAGGLAEVHRVLRPGGRLCLADHFAIGVLHPLFSVLRKRRRMRTRSEVESMLQAVGFEVVGWRLVARAGPLPFIRAVLARRCG